MTQLHEKTQELVDDFFDEFFGEFRVAIEEKLHAAQLKYGYTDLWANKDWEEECRRQLMIHIEKGDPRDVAAYCMFMWKNGWKTSVSQEETK